MTGPMVRAVSRLAPPAGAARSHVQAAAPLSCQPGRRAVPRRREGKGQTSSLVGPGLAVGGRRWNRARASVRRGTAEGQRALFGDSVRHEGARPGCGFAPAAGRSPPGLAIGSGIELPRVPVSSSCLAGWHRLARWRDARSGGVTTAATPALLQRSMVKCSNPAPPWVWPSARRPAALSGGLVRVAAPGEDRLPGP
jgi:hypothetical protein